MPCTYTGSIEGDRALAASEVLTEVTQMLCQACQILEDAGMLNALNIKTKKFWMDHKKRDAKRTEEAMSGVLDKLSTEELEVLLNVPIADLIRLSKKKGKKK